jgi:triacylglycerol lipase
MKRALMAAILCLSAADAAFARDCVVLLHGMGRTHLSMLRLQSSLESDGYEVWNRSYPSTRNTIVQLAPVVGEAVQDCRKRQTRQIHFVTHSLGGILVRAYFQNHAVPEARRIVMLGPPNHGSQAVDSYRDSWWFRKATGPAGQQLGTGPDSAPNRLAPIRLEVGIIAGTKSSDPWFSNLFQEAHDGKVSVSSAKLPEMKDFLLVESGHTFMMNSNEVIRQVKVFLRIGAFDKSP